MLKRISVLMLLVLFSIMPVYAAVEISGQGGTMIQRDDEQSFDDIQIETERGYFGLGRVTADVTDNVAVGLSSGFMTAEYKTLGVTLGDTQTIPLLGNIIIKFPINTEEVQGRVVPYIVGGVGVVFNSFDEDNMLSKAEISIDDDTSFAAQIGLGTDFYVAENVAVFVEGSYLLSEYGVKMNSPFGSVSDEIDTSSWLIGGGIKIRI